LLFAEDPLGNCSGPVTLLS